MQCLDASKISSLQTVSPIINEGSSIIYRCTVFWENDSEAKASYLKCFLAKNDKALCNEITGYMIAKNANLPVPEHAAYIDLNQDILNQTLDDILEHFDCDGFQYGFIMSVSPGDTCSNLFSNSCSRENKIAIMKVVSQNENLPKIIAFDEWIANVDRHASNFLISGKKIYIIDHSNALTSPCWNNKCLDPKIIYKNIIYDEFEFMSRSTSHSFELPKNEEVMKAADYFKNLLHVQYKSLKIVWDKLLNDSNSVALVYKFLEYRAENKRTTSYCIQNGERI
ncbi:TPA: hypothetical protein ACRRX1_001294 [Morganella morganii]